MKAYAVGVLHDVHLGSDIRAYLERIDATLLPHGGRFLIHGDRPTVLEGQFDGDLIVIEFPTMDAARRWYASAAYQALVPLRARNSTGVIFLVAGVAHGHAATDVLAPRAGRVAESSVGGP